MAGDDRHSASDGARRLVEVGAKRLRAAGVGTTVERIDRGGPFRDTASSSAMVNQRLAAAVRRAMAQGRLPVALAGSCVAALGVLAGFDHVECGAVWLDAHADFNTPESTASGFFPGMSAAIVAGHCYRSYWGQAGDNRPLPEETVVMLGIRDLSPLAERERLGRSAIEVVPWRWGRADGDVLAVLDQLARRVDDVYLHVDMDAFDPEVAPGVVDEPVPGGLSLGDAETIIRATGERFRVRAATVATFTPERDQSDRTLLAALRVIELVGECALRDGPGPGGASSE